MAKFEIKKSRKRYGGGSSLLIILAVAVSVLLGYASVITGIDSDRGIYTANVKVGLETFTTSSSPDVALFDGKLFVEQNDKSLAAADELLKHLKEEHRKRIEKEFGEMAHPVRVSVVYLDASRIMPPETGGKMPESVGNSGSALKTTTAVTTTTAVKTTTAVEESAPATLESNATYVPPEDIKTPGLVDRIVMAFLFVIPSYFAVQVFSSSLLEDKLLRRLEVLLSAVGHFIRTLPHYGFYAVLLQHESSES